MDRKEYIVGIDIGSSKVTMAVCTKAENDEISVLGVEVQDIAEEHVRGGDIQNFIEVGNAIKEAKNALEQELNVNLNSAYVGVSGKSAYCVRYEDYVPINSLTSCVTENELHELNERIKMAVPGGGDTIIERIPLRYRVDDRPDVKNPLGAFGRKLAATYLFVMLSNQQIDLVNRAMHHAGLKVSGLCVNPTILPQLLLNENEREEGVAIVDIGAEVTDIAVVKDGKLCYFSSLPIGASSINSDLRGFLMLPKKDIDKVKRMYGSATADGVDEDNVVSIRTSRNTRKQVLQRNIAEITQERLKDIIGFVARELKVSQFATKLPCGMVLTGGSAYLSNIEELFARELNMEVRLGRVLNGLDANSQEVVSTFNQAAALGLLLYGAKHGNCETSNKLPQPQVVSQPQQPVMPKPQTPVVPQPQQPVMPKPQPPVVPQPPQPVMPKPQPPVVPQPPQPVMPKPQPPVVPQPPQPVTPQPQQPVQQEPTVTPDAPVTPEPTVEPEPVVKQPEEPKKPDWREKLRGWIDRTFTNDEYI